MLVVHKKSGFTLVEVVVTLAVVSTVFVIFQTSLNTIYLNRRVKHEEVALRIANSKIELIRALTYDTLPTTGAFHDPLLANLPVGAAVVAVSDYATDLKQVTVTVSWQERVNGVSRELSVTTLVARGGL